MIPAVDLFSPILCGDDVVWADRNMHTQENIVTAKYWREKVNSWANDSSPTNFVVAETEQGVLEAINTAVKVCLVISGSWAVDMTNGKATGQAPGLVKKIHHHANIYAICVYTGSAAAVTTC